MEMLAQARALSYQVIESALAPRTRMHGNLFVKTSDALTEPLGDRIIEVPADFERMSRTDDPRIGFVAYVPPGSVARGRRWSTRRSAKTSEGTAACATVAHLVQIGAHG